MKKTIIIVLSLFAFKSNAQIFSVIARDNKSKATLEDQLKYDGYKVVDTSKQHDYEIELLVTGEYKVITLKQTHQGYAILRNAKTGEQLYKTKEYKSSPAAINGYNAANAIANKAIKKEFAEMLQKTKKL
jgi:hypothetical protein